MYRSTYEYVDAGKMDYDKQFGFREGEETRQLNIESAPWWM